jgi:hypothetical protein
MSALQASGHEDDFSRRHLPPMAQWPELLAPPRGLSYPARLNAAEALVDAQVSAGHGHRVALRGARHGSVAHDHPRRSDAPHIGRDDRRQDESVVGGGGRDIELND